MTRSIRQTIYILVILLSVATAFGLRTHVARTIGIDYDEDDYLRAGQEFAHLIRTSDWAGFLDTNYRSEHPQLAKIMFGLSILGLPEEPLVADIDITAPPAKELPKDLLHAARGMSVIWGTIATGLLALINPLGGLILAIHTQTIRYTSEVMLDGLASVMSTAAGVTYYLSKRRKEKAKRTLLVLSAIFLGMSTSSKYLHSAIGFAILIDWFFTAKASGGTKRFLRNAFLWGTLSLTIFVLCNPFYWAHPLESIRSTYNAVAATTMTSSVERANFPMWQQLMFLSMSVPLNGGGDTFLLRADGLIFVFAIIGLARTWKRDRFIAIWLFVDLFLLLIWRTKWPQYILAATAPLAFIAAEGVKVLAADLLDWWQNRHKRGKEAAKPSKRDTLRAIPWLVPGLIIFLILTLLPLIFQIGISLTDFNVTSLRDGLTGGLWRAISEGLTGRTPIADTDIFSRPNKVNFTGLKSYPAVFDFITGSFSTWNILFFNTLWTVLSVILQGALGLGVALLLWQKGVKLSKFWQAFFILPWAIPEMIGSLMWLNIFIPTIGWLALAVQQFGENIPFGFFNTWDSSSDLWLVVYLLAAIWYGFPFMMLASSVGLKSVPRDVFDAAAIDGANALQTFRYVTWPLLLPLLIPAVIVRAIFSFNQFYLFQTFYWQDSTLATLSYNVFNPSGGFGAQGQFAVSAVINIITVLILMILILLFNRWSKVEEGVTYA